ncbi:MAG TPA: aspartate/glutamate racemase family protein, partial [Solirubrobacteraceae bacterium]|nr:aspartate/glutamate racemase family protein [Solirubrobacteraceae bacterium]
ILACTPLHVGAAELARRQERYDRIAPPGMRIQLRDLPPSAPRSLECEADMRASERYVIESLRAVPDGFDAVLADCVLDPGITTLQRELSLPALGILRLNLAHGRALGRPSAAVVRNGAIAAEMRAVADACGLGDALLDVMLLDLDFSAVADHDRWQARLAEVAVGAARAGARHLLNGCSAVDTDAVGAPIAVYDPVARALALAAAGTV